MSTITKMDNLHFVTYITAGYKACGLLSADYKAVGRTYLCVLFILLRRKIMCKKMYEAPALQNGQKKRFNLTLKVALYHHRF